MTGKSLRKIIHKLLLISYKLKKNMHAAYISKRKLKHENQISLLNDSKQRRMALSCSRKIMCIIKRNNVKTCR